MLVRATSRYFQDEEGGKISGRRWERAFMPEARSKRSLASCKVQGEKNSERSKDGMKCVDSCEVAGGYTWPAGLLVCALVTLHL